jgi:HlyD family secretion protein
MASVAELDNAVESLERARAGLESAKASLASARASVEQSEASVSKAKADLDYCTIRSPVNGVVIARKVDEGETVVSSMNAVPVLTIAEDLKTIWIEATVPEADVGDIKVGQEVTFTADAYRRRFKGKVRQIRLAATTTNNVVTYPIIIEADNPGEMLFPGMTATLSIETARAENAVVVSAAAFRFRPKDSDRASGEAPRGRKIWLVGPDGKLSARAVSEGVTDGSFTQILDADDLEGSQAVAGYETARTAAAASGDTRNPFMPKMPRRGTSGTAPEPKK